MYNIVSIIDLYGRGGAEKVYNNFSLFCKENNINLFEFVLYQSERNNIPFFIKNNSNNVFIKIYHQIYAGILLRNFCLNKKINRIVSFLDRSNIVSIISMLLSKGKYKVTITIHNPPTIQYKKLNFLLKNMTYFLLRVLYNLKNVKVVAVSSSVADSLANIKVKNVEIIYNPVLLNEEDIPSENMDYKFILAIGRLEYQKAYWKLIKAFAIYKKKKRDNLHLIVLGSGKESENLVKLSIDLGVSDCVHFNGYVINPSNYLKKMEFIVFSSIFEGFPISLIESFLLCKPFIGSKESIPKEIVDVLGEKYDLLTYSTTVINEDYNSNCFDVDSEKLASLLLDISENEKLREDVAQICNKWAIDKCSIANYWSYIDGYKN